MTGKIDLLPCPFCGGEPDISAYQDEDIWTHNTVTWTRVHCPECGIEFSSPPDAKEDAVTRWNTRTTVTNRHGRDEDERGQWVPGPLTESERIPMSQDNSASEAVFPTQHLEDGITIRGPDGYGDFSVIFRDPDLADPLGAGLVFITKETAERIRDHLAQKISQWSE